MAPGVSTALLFLLSFQVCNTLSYYEYFVPDGTIDAGLVAEGDSFTLNNKEIVIFSGTFHYFRVHPDHWRDTFKKLRAAGLNAVETYVPWNLHEPRQRVFDFGDLGEDMSKFLDVRAFVQMAQEEDLFVFFRPGPYICAEWEFGGLPSWLLRDDNMQVRVDYAGYVDPVVNFFNNLLPIVVDLQFTSGGPIIAIQIENEYGSFGDGKNPPGKQYLELLRDTLTANGFQESLYFTSDGILWNGDKGAVDGALMTANFNNQASENLARLKELQPNRPLMVMEYWTGWFDHWLASSHSVTDPNEFGATLEEILLQNSSVNMYMFIGGTTFGFMAGANVNSNWPFYTPDTTSYDYDAPLSEVGDYTHKYYIAKDIISRYNPLEGIVDHPAEPPQRQKFAYASVAITESLDFATLLSQQTSVDTNGDPMNMELLPINDNNGQSYGYVVYTTQATLTPTSTLLIRERVRDMAQVLIDGAVVTNPYSDPSDISGFGFWDGRDQELALPGNDQLANINIMIENLARVNFGGPENFHEQKGLWEGPVLIDGVQIDHWTIQPLELKGQDVSSLTGWNPFTGSLETPAMYRGNLEITDTLADTFLDMRAWNKGVVFVNGFNLGRFWKVGPPRTLYVPAPFLVNGVNEIIVFEQYSPGPDIAFTDAPILG